MTVVSLASGSAGNAYLVGAADTEVDPPGGCISAKCTSWLTIGPPGGCISAKCTSWLTIDPPGGCISAKCTSWLMIDCGLGPRELKARLAAVGLPADLPLAGLVVTHNHIDHISGLEAFHRHYPDVPIFANLMTAEASAARVKADPGIFTCFENGQDFDVGPFAVHPFSIPHDTCDPVGYLVRADGLTYFHGTDIGTPLDSIGLQLREADVATLESNHDSVMLRTSPRAASLKQRIAGPRGHLSNDEAAELVRRFAAPRLKALALAHLSRECNTPRFAVETMRETLAGLKRPDLALTVLEQDAPRVVVSDAVMG